MDPKKLTLATLTRGNAADRGWTETEDGNWVPSVWDRRRLGVAHLDLYAEIVGQDLPGPIVAKIMRHHATDHTDFEKLAENFFAWMNRNDQA